LAIDIPIEVVSLSAHKRSGVNRIERLQRLASIGNYSAAREFSADYSSRSAKADTDRALSAFPLPIR
jgi:hypothetical protein